MPPVYILILNYKNWQDTLECLKSVSGLEYPNFRTIVIDNASGNDSLEQLMIRAKETGITAAGQSPSGADTGVAAIETDARATEAGAPATDTGMQYVHGRDLGVTVYPDSFSRLVFIQNEKNAGFAGGNNVILKLLAGLDAYIWLLNPDMTVEPGTLTRLVEFAADHPCKTIIGSVIKYHEQRDRVHFYGGFHIRFYSATVLPITTPGGLARLDYISGGSLFTPAAAFRDIGLLPEEYFLYWEETDWCYKARQAGYELAVCPAAICYDKVGTTIGRGFLAEYYYTRNGLLFVSRYKARKLPFVFFFSLFRLLKRTLSGRWDRARGIREGIKAYLKRNNHEAQ